MTRTLRRLSLNIFQKTICNDAKKSARPSRRRPATFEPLESRALLSVSPTEYAAIRDAYPEFELPASANDVEIIEIDAVSATAAALKNAVAKAQTTSANDLIVVRTTASKNEIDFASSVDEIVVDANARAKGSVAIVALGASRLTLDGNGATRFFDVGRNAVLKLGNVALKNGFATDGKTVKNILGPTFTYGAGGAIFNAGTVVASNVEFIGNAATSASTSDYNFGFNASGGAVYNSGTFRATECVFSENVAYSGGANRYQIAAVGAGGAVFNERGASANVENTTFANNVAQNDVVTVTIKEEDEEGKIVETTVEVERDGVGGAVCDVGGSFTATNVEFSANQAAFGGAVRVESSGSTVRLSRTSVVGNVARKDGGGCLFDGDSFVENVVASGNVAGASGGAFYVSATGTLAAVCVTVAGNVAVRGGGAAVEGTLRATDSIVASNAVSGEDATGADVDRVANGRVDGFYVLSSFDGYSTAQGTRRVETKKSLFKAAPTFDASGALSNADSLDLRLADYSQAIDAGSGALAVGADGAPATLDRDGKARVVGNEIDLGAFEFADGSAYAASDVVAARAFLEQTDDAGVSNAEKLTKKLGAQYDPNNPKTFGGIVWTKVDGVWRLQKLVADSDDLVGTLNWRGLDALASIELNGATRVAEISLSDCAALTKIAVSNVAPIRFETSDCPSLTTVDFGDSPVESLKIARCAAVRELVCRNYLANALDATGLPKLESLRCRGASLTEIVLTGAQTDASCEIDLTDAGGATSYRWRDAFGNVVSTSATATPNGASLWFDATTETGDVSTIAVSLIAGNDVANANVSNACGLSLDAAQYVSNAAEYEWDFDGDGDFDDAFGRFAAVDRSTRSLGTAYVAARVRAKSNLGEIVDAKTVVATVSEAEPTLNVRQTNDFWRSIVRFDVGVAAWGVPAARRAEFDWGDGTRTPLSEWATDASAAHYYAPKAKTVVYSITLALIDANGTKSTFGVGTFTVEGRDGSNDSPTASKASESTFAPIVATETVLISQTQPFSPTLSQSSEPSTFAHSQQAESPIGANAERAATLGDVRAAAIWEESKDSLEIDEPILPNVESTLRRDKFSFSFNEEFDFDFEIEF